MNAVSEVRRVVATALGQSIIVLAQPKQDRPAAVSEQLVRPAEMAEKGKSCYSGYRNTAMPMLALTGIGILALLCIPALRTKTGCTRDRASQSEPSQARETKAA